MKILQLVIAILLFIVIFVAIDNSTMVWGGKEETKYITIEEIAGGKDMRYGIFSDFIFAFELLSLLLLSALIGAIYLAKKEV